MLILWEFVISCDNLENVVVSTQNDNQFHDSKRPATFRKSVLHSRTFGSGVFLVIGKIFSYEKIEYFIEGNSMIRFYGNQAGYLPKSRKVVILAQELKTDGAEMKWKAGKSQNVSLWNAKGDKIAVRQAVYAGVDESAEDEVWHVDFSDITEEGVITFRDEEGKVLGSSTISRQTYCTLNQILCKALYFQRCGMALEEKYAGKFKRCACHTGTAVQLVDYLNHNKEAKQYEVTGGWHDAGDYGRYTTAAATALAHMLYAQQLFPESFSENLNIPESTEEMPDILSECLYELRWLLKMQMEDGSVCHKLTSMRHANFVMPDEDGRQMILFPASTMAVADFAAIMALAARVYSRWEPVFATEAEAAAVRAWNWLMQHPEFIGFQNPEGCNTGGYEDTCDLDERLWAATELYVTTGDAVYLTKLEELVKTNENLTDMGWVDVSGLAGLSCLFGAKQTQNAFEQNDEKNSEKQRFQVYQQKFRQAFLAEADKICGIAEASRYFVALTKEEYGWGSNMVVLNRAMILTVASLLTGDGRYRTTAQEQMDYILGENATGYSYVTGFGEKSCQNPHNRVTVSDGIEETIPGFVVGGPNSAPVDEKAEWLITPDTPPMKCFLDVWECYSLNEITIYWNSPAIFVAAFLRQI